jgi:hypothetical protein
MKVDTSFTRAVLMGNAIEAFNYRYSHKKLSPFWVKSHETKPWLWTFHCVDRNDKHVYISLDVHDMDQDKITT